MVHSEHIHTCYSLLNCSGSGERHRIHDNGENKSVEFEATVSIFIIRCTYKANIL